MINKNLLNYLNGEVGILPSSITAGKTAEDMLREFDKLLPIIKLNAAAKEIEDWDTEIREDQEQLKMAVMISRNNLIQRATKLREEAKEAAKIW